MIRADIFSDAEGTRRKIVIDGHADYAESGKDIVCAAVSVLALNMANSVEKFTEDPFDASEDDGYFVFEFSGSISDAGKLLMNSLILGLQSIEESYGKTFIQLNFREV